MPSKSSTLTEITRWKLEAAEEDISRYFHYLEPISTLTSGEKAYVIGRKGAGKTAICKFLESQRKHDIFTAKLSFKNFPFNLLYEHSDNQYTRPSQYISLWNYIIYSSICREMARNEAINLDVRKTLAALFPPDAELHLRREIENWTSVEFNAQVLGTGASLNVRKDAKPIDS